MRVVVYKLQEKIQRLVELMEKVEEMVWSEYERMLQGGVVGVGGVERLLDKLHRYVMDMVVMVERLNRLRKEVSEVDEVVDRLVYLILQLDERGRERVGEVLQEEFGRMKYQEERGEVVVKLEKLVERLKEQVGGRDLGELLSLVRNEEDLFLCLCSLGEVEWFGVVEEVEGKARLKVKVVVDGKVVRELFSRCEDFWWRVVEVVGDGWILMGVDVEELMGVLESDEV